MKNFLKMPFLFAAGALHYAAKPVQEFKVAAQKQHRLATPETRYAFAGYHAN